MTLFGGFGIAFECLFVILRHTVLAVIIFVTESIHFPCAQGHCFRRLLFGNILTCNTFSANSAFSDLQAGFFFCRFLGDFPFAGLMSAKRGDGLYFLFSAIAGPFPQAFLDTGCGIDNGPRTEFVSLGGDTLFLFLIANEALSDAQAVRFMGCFPDGLPIPRNMPSQRANGAHFLFSAITDPFLHAVFGAGSRRCDRPITKAVSARRCRNGLAENFAAIGAASPLGLAALAAGGLHGRNDIDVLMRARGFFLPIYFPDDIAEFDLVKAVHDLHRRIYPFIAFKKLDDGAGALGARTDTVFDARHFVFFRNLRVRIAELFGRISDIHASDVGDFFFDRTTGAETGMFAGNKQKAGAVFHRFLQFPFVILYGTRAVAQIALRNEAGKSVQLQILAKRHHCVHIL